MEGEMDSKFGKPLYIDPEDRSTLSLFFDDNIFLDDREKNIIAPMNAKTGEPISIAELAALNQVFCVDTLEAILNDDYFIDLVLNTMNKNFPKIPLLLYASNGI